MSSSEQNYSIEQRQHGAELVYSDNEVEVFLARTFREGHRLFFSGTQADSCEQPLSLRKRLDLLDKLCAHYDSTQKPLIIVLDETDRDLALMEGRITDLIEDGHRLALERDGEGLRAERLDRMYLDILESGNQLSIDGVEIGSVAAYEAWKSAPSGER